MDNLDFNYFCQGCQRTEEYRRANCFTNYRIRRYAKGEHITFTGQLTKELSVVVEGAINVSFVLESGLISRSIDHLPPTPIGGVALLSKNNRYRVDTTAIEECTVISIPRDEVIRQMGQCEDFLVSFIDFTTSRVDALSSHLAILTQRSIKAKLSHYILTNRDGEHYDMRRSIKSLAEYLCVERPSLSRVIGEMVREGAITHHNGKGEIVDIEILKRALSL